MLRIPRVAYLIMFLGVSIVSVNIAFATSLGGTPAGIGTSSPQSSLHLSDSGVSAVRLEETSGNKIWIFANDKTNFNNAFTIWNPTAGTTVLVDYATGNVGIGTSTPMSPLHIKSAGISSVRLEESVGNKIWIFANDKTNFNNAFTIWNPTAGTTVLVDYATGNVGIGT
ncbi:MAG: hypothetical protein ACYC9R_10130, partial [Nitrosotalea sp.]